METVHGDMMLLTRFSGDIRFTRRGRQRGTILRGGAHYARARGIL